MSRTRKAQQKEEEAAAAAAAAAVAGGRTERSGSSVSNISLPSANVVTTGPNGDVVVSSVSGPSNGQAAAAAWTSTVSEATAL
jgi:hypothetical protein